ncbi:MAG: AAA family ATPase [Candidatus Dormibacteria bacterium]
MGIPGAGKSRLAEKFVARDYVRLNRDEVGESLGQIAVTLDARLSAGSRRVVLDNTYLTRASRSYVIETAKRHWLATRCIWLDTPLAQAQVNLVERILLRAGSLPSPEELRSLARTEPGVLMPTSQMRALRQLEEPATDEGFGHVERLAFMRSPRTTYPTKGTLVAAAALSRPGWKDAVTTADPGAPHLVFDWNPDGMDERLNAAVRRISELVTGPVQGAFCPHPAGPPVCWCRPPLPGLPLAFAQTRKIDLARSILVGVTPADRTLATTLGATFVQV